MYGDHPIVASSTHHLSCLLEVEAFLLVELDLDCGRMLRLLSPAFRIEFPDREVVEAAMKGADEVALRHDLGLALAVPVEGVALVLSPFRCALTGIRRIPSLLDGRQDEVHF